MRRVNEAEAAEIVVKLAELQGAQTDETFAALLGCSRVHWSRLKSGERQPSWALMKRAVHRFPQVYRIVLLDMVREPVEAAV